SHAGAAAMLYMSEVPGNQIQIGSIREKWEAMEPIPTITIGEDDGNRLRCLIGAGTNQPNTGGRDSSTSSCSSRSELRATSDVKAKCIHGAGRNVIGIVPGRNFGKRDAQGKSLDHQIVYGAHYDTWYIGSADNGCGVAALLSLAEVRARPPVPPEYTLVFAAY